jgi:hypothetical protein
MFNVKKYLTLRDNYIRDNSQLALAEVQNYLDSENLFMPAPKYLYDDGDKTTWRFLVGKIVENEHRKKTGYRNVYNPHFRYGNLV